MPPEISALRTGRTPSVPTEDLAERRCYDDRNVRLSQWFEAWRGAMRRWLSSRSSIQPADLDDVAQEVFLRLIRYSDDALVEYPQSYLFRIATNVVNEWHERARNKLPHDDAGLEALQEESHREPENFTERTLVNSHVREAVDRLPPRQRAVLLLHINDELTYKQIAVKLKLSPRIVRRDIANAYMQLRCDLHSVHQVGHSQQELRARTVA
ncbi:MAG TPA: RNA polymerase sigma factor [Steroidobacter sp.]|uniref:RNA polymerase sigma factor n=1 Tax=Steroidobacter sp. TaxID=1978227 RepID=UPI002ED8B2D2